MDSYSTTQATNLTSIAAAIALVFSHPDLSNVANIETLLTALVILVAAGYNFYNRFKKGDLTPTGFRKPN